MTQKRLDYLDMAKGIGIFFVVLGHIEYIQETTLKWIFSFHMPLFFVVGGVLACVQGNQTTTKEFFKKRAKGILIPYYSFSLSLLTMDTLDVLFFSDTLTGRELARYFVDTLTGYGIHILWFLPAYFLANAVFFLVGSYTKERYWIRDILLLGLAFTALLISQCLHLDEYTAMEGTLFWYAGADLLITILRGLLACPFLLLGWYLALYWKKSDARRRRLAPDLAAAAFLLIFGSFLAVRSSIFDLHYLYVKPLHYLTAACMCTGILLLLRRIPVIRALCYLGRNSLVIMCTHAIFFVVYYVSLGMFFVIKFIPMSQPVFNGSIAVLVCVAEIPIIWFFNRFGKHILGRTV